jgi:DNA repair protein RadC
MKVVRVRELTSGRRTVDTPWLAADVWRADVQTAQWFDPTKEQLVAILLDTRLRLLGVTLVAMGTACSVLVGPPEVFRAAILAGAQFVVLAHNHPSGDPNPSWEDILVTRALSRASKSVGVRLVDHVVVGHGSSHVSLRAMGQVRGLATFRSYGKKKASADGPAARGRDKRVEEGRGKRGRVHGAGRARGAGRDPHPYIRNAYAWALHRHLLGDGQAAGAAAGRAKGGRR